MQSSIAIARLGGKVNFISKIGKDAYGELALKLLKKIKLILKILFKMKIYKLV